MITNELTFNKETTDNVKNDEVICGQLQDGFIGFRFLPLEKVYPNPNQPRKVFDKEALDELSVSIGEHGVLQPILVRQIGEKYQIVSGERRYRASKQAGLRSIPAVVRQLSPESTMLAGLIENIHRQDLNPIEEARSLRDIILNFNLTHEQLAARLGRSRSALTNRLRLLQLPAEVQLMVAEGRITPGHAKMLAGIKDATELRTLARRIIKEGLSVFEIEKQIEHDRHTKASTTSKEKGSKVKMVDTNIRAIEENLQELLGAKVKIKQTRNKGKIEIEFYDNGDLERVIDSIVALRL
jgi:ParB family chromosome partitioning protein